MKNKSIQSKFFSGIVMASMILSSTSAFANTTNSTTASSTDAAKTAQKTHGNHKGGNRFKTQLDTLVSAGTITSDEKAAIIVAFENNK